jgi:magnesium transporter
MDLTQLKALLENETLPQGDFVRAVNGIDHFVMARNLHQLSNQDKLRIFHSLDSDTKRQELIYETDVESRNAIVESIEPELLARFLVEMEQDEATDILQEQSPDVQDEVLSKMWPTEADVLKNLIRYDEETAGGMMTPNYNRISPDQTAAEVLMALKRDANKERLPYYYVLGSNNELLGFFKLRDLLNVAPHTKASQIMRAATPKVHLNDACDKVAQLMDQEMVSSVPVVDDRNAVQGIITFDDVLRVTREIADQEIYAMAGTPETDPFAQKTSTKVTSRLPWLMLTFVGGMISAYLLHHFETNMKEFGTVIFFLPFVLGLAGNISIQGATVLVRGLATGDIQKDNLKKVVSSEISVGVLNGVAFGVLCGIIVAVISPLLLHSIPELGLAVGIGIIVAVSSAAFMGSTFPVIFLKMGIDPAISTGPALTVINDILGLIIYMTTATLIYFLF